jgi:phosphoglucomutase
VPELQKQIAAGDWDMLMDKFYRVLIFGTGGIRGKMDIGTNRMNAYMIRWASQAYAEYLKKYKPELVDNGVAIAYDSRNNSQRFMEETARVLAGNGIKTYVFRDCRATPELSFTVRHLNLAGGIVVTASHNPPEFNGYKVYAETGVQVLEQAGREIEKEFQTVVKINKMTFSEAVEAGKVIYISEEVDRAFAESAKKVSVYAGRDVKIVYSPLHGVGSESVLPVLRNLGFEDVQVVDSQMSFPRFNMNWRLQQVMPAWVIRWNLFHVLQLKEQENSTSSMMLGNPCLLSARRKILPLQKHKNSQHGGTNSSTC